MHWIRHQLLPHWPQLIPRRSPIVQKALPQPFRMFVIVRNAFNVAGE
jgi:hypothetical protein